MKVVLLAGGFGTRISEESGIRPKPMVQIGGKPILWHIMKIYSAAGIDEFIICLGYKGYVIKEYFATYSLHMSDVTFDLRKNNMQVHQNGTEPWKVISLEPIMILTINTSLAARLEETVRLLLKRKTDGVLFIPLELPGA